jgi:apolipoprotein N-acyltransferase
VDDELYYNALMSIGHADGLYFKQHLVPLGEFTPSFLTRLSHWLHYPLPNMAQGVGKQVPITIHNYPIASLICYELAYPELLRQQLPQAQWIVSISDDGWFGQSLAVYQHLQMAQVFSKLSGRYQIVSNNSGLSAIINEKGQIEQSLPAFTAGTLQSLIHPCTGSTPWVVWGEMPAVLLAISVVLIASMHMTLNRRRINVHRWRYLIKAIADSWKRRYPY